VGNFPLQPQLPLVFIHLQFERSREEINVAVESDIKQCFSGEEDCKFSAKLSEDRRLAGRREVQCLSGGLTLMNSLSHLWCWPEGVGRPPGKV
jgi:hypothetical protein